MALQSIIITLDCSVEKANQLYSGIEDLFDTVEFEEEEIHDSMLLHGTLMPGVSEERGRWFDWVGYPHQFDTPEEIREQLFGLPPEEGGE